MKFLREPLDDFSLSDMAQAIIDQLAYDLAAIIQFAWRDTANWQLLPCQVALQGPLKENSSNMINTSFLLPFHWPFPF